jgi:hypothetical protein
VPNERNIGSGYWVISVNGMRRSNVIIYQNETKFEIYCNDKTESHHINDIFLKVAGHAISIKRIFDFRTSPPINEILYIQNINGKRKKVEGKKITG